MFSDRTPSSKLVLNISKTSICFQSRGSVASVLFFDCEKGTVNVGAACASNNDCLSNSCTAEKCTVLIDITFFKIAMGVLNVGPC